MADVSFVRRLLSERRSRGIAEVLGYIERQNWWGKLSANERLQLRDRVMTSITAHHDACLDILTAAGVEEQNAVLNERALELIRDLHRKLDQLRDSNG